MLLLGLFGLLGLVISAAGIYGVITYALAASIASIIPAGRAAKVDPMRALRSSAGRASAGVFLISHSRPEISISPATSAPLDRARPEKQW